MPSVFDEEYRRDARVFNDALNLLNITFNTSKKDARRAYFNLARVHHPDKGGSTEMFLRVKTAYDHVTNDAIRQWAQRAFDYIDIQAQREALRARNADRQAARDERKRKRDEDTLKDILARCMADYENLNAKRQKTTWQTPDTTAQQRASRNAARTARAARRAAKAAHKATKYILDCQRAFSLVLQQRANLKT